jgi:hypothetical protein
MHFAAYCICAFHIIYAKKTSIIHLDIINRLDFVIDTKCAFCEAENEIFMSNLAVVGP